MKECIVCNNNVFSDLYKQTLLKCNCCGFITANVELSDKDLREIYSENYFKGQEYYDYLGDKTIIQYNFKKRLDYIQKAKGLNSINSVLEIGCAYGFFAQVFAQRFPGSNYIGIDVEESAITFARDILNINVVLGDYLQFSFDPEFSEIFMWDVIEHLKEPGLYLEKLYNEIKNDGRLYITTGDIDALVPKIQKDKWRMIHPPSHLHYFSKKTITKLLQTKGFVVEFITYPAIYRSIKQMFYSLFILNKKPNSFIRLVFNLLPERAYLPINLHDIMFIGARKATKP